MLPLFIGVVLAVAALSPRIVAAGSLTLRLSGPQTITSPELPVIATLTNTGDEELVLLNDPRTILTDIPTYKFVVKLVNINEEGKQRAARILPFIGPFAKYVQEAANVTTLAAGASISVSHSMSEAYDIMCSGAGNYTIHPATSSFYVLTSIGIEEITVADIMPYTARMPKEVLMAAKQPSSCGEEDEDIDYSPIYVKDIPLTPLHPTFIGCSSSRQKQIIVAIRTAQTYAMNAYMSLYSISVQSDNTSVLERYTTWFGTFTDKQYPILFRSMHKIVTHPFMTSTYSCHCDYDVHAYVYELDPRQIWLCAAFWTASPTGPDSRAGTLIHAASRWTHTAKAIAIFDREEVSYEVLPAVYGQAGAQDLARCDPVKAIQNADNYEYFAENPSAFDLQV